MRSSFTLNLTIGLVSVPVKGYSTKQTPKDDVHLNQLHEDCHCRIKYKKVCPAHGEVAQDQIVKGYEYAKDQYVLIDPEEAKGISKEIKISKFCSDNVDFRRVDGSAYYLKPDKGGDKSYNLLLAALQETAKWGLGTAVIQGKDRIVRLGAVESRLYVQILRWDSEVRDAGEVDTGDPSHSEEELAMMCKLIDTTDKDVDTASDPHQARLAALVEAKLGTEGAVSPAVVEEDSGPAVVNLMDALKMSIARAG